MAGRSALNKGKNGEREVAAILNGLSMRVLRELGFPETEISARSIQRNQNQSAVGGNDLSNCMGLGIEVKRHENLSGINGWWTQCVEGAKRNNEHPLLIYRPNHSPWKYRTIGHLHVPHGGYFSPAVVDFTHSDFETWFMHWCRYWYLQGGEQRT